MFIRVVATLIPEAITDNKSLNVACVSFIMMMTMIFMISLRTYISHNSFIIIAILNSRSHTRKLLVTIRSNNFMADFIPPTVHIYSSHMRAFNNYRSSIMYSSESLYRGMFVLWLSVLKTRNLLHFPTSIFTDSIPSTISVHISMNTPDLFQEFSIFQFRKRSALIVCENDR